MENFALYEKHIETTVTTVKHTVRILLNSNRKAIEQALENVPYGAVVSMIVDDTKLDNYGEIVFIEEIS